MAAGVVFGSTFFIFIASSALANLLTKNYFKAKNKSFLYWSLGMWLFAFAVLLEVVFSFSIYIPVLMGGYLFAVAVLVQLLSMGSLNLMKKGRYMVSYTVYSVAVDIFLLLSLTYSPVGNIIIGGVVFGPLPFLVAVASSFVTFPAAFILIVTAAISYREKKSHKMLYIIAGTVVVSIAGTLYIAAFPSFLYYAEFIGILLLWMGFVDFSTLFVKKGVKKVVYN
ncbi:hypothetical protein OXIME_001705 [Oxyplasma meridianum]|uniref:Multipass membrane protein n=1 Tax=Oxyplasma meridianum TaxID=3073602 RepID=A0AAX4NIS5_9ARCH